MQIEIKENTHNLNNFPCLVYYGCSRDLALVSKRLSPSGEFFIVTNFETGWSIEYHNEDFKKLTINPLPKGAQIRLTQD